MSNIKLSIVVPCYNEAKNIPLILEKFASAINRDDIEVILVNNGSKDNSEEVINELLPKYSFAKTILVPVNLGYGYGILSGLNACEGDFIGWTHADMQTDPADPIKALDLILKSDNPSQTYAKGLRRGRAIFDEIFTTGMSIFETIYLGTKLWDINAQPNIFPKTFFNSWQNPPHDFSFDLFALYQARKMKLNLIRFEVFFPPRIYGESSWNTGFSSKWKFIKRTIEFSTKLKNKLA